MKQTIAIILTAAALIGALKIAQQSNAIADQPRHHSVVVLRYETTYHPEKNVLFDAAGSPQNGVQAFQDAAGKFYYMAEDGYAILFSVCSDDAPLATNGMNLAHAMSLYLDAGYRFEPETAFGRRTATRTRP